MPAKPHSRHRKTRTADRGRKVFNRIVENDLIRRVSYEEYRDKVRDVYGGPKGAMLATCSVLSLHVPLGERLFREREFDLRGARSILDVGSGAGQIAKHLVKYADRDAQVTCLDLSQEMLRRARQRLRQTKGTARGAREAGTQGTSSTPHGTAARGTPSFVTADLARMPFVDGSFDCVTCGYVLEHLPNPRTGLAELSRVLTCGGRMFLLTTEDSFSGAWTSRMWCCRTYNRHELMKICESLDLFWKKELWFTRMHKVLRAGGICVEIEKR
jgi:SAM-dependent methyltransferase